MPLPVSDRCFSHLQPTLLQRAKPSNFLLDRKKTDKLKKKKKRKRRDSDAPGKEGYRGGLLKLEAADPYVETPTSPTLQDIPQAPSDPCSGWDSDTPSSGSCATVSPDQVKEIKTEGKRTIVRQGKQVVFRDEDSTGNDEDIMVDSGEWSLRDDDPCWLVVRREVILLNGHLSGAQGLVPSVECDSPTVQGGEKLQECGYQDV